MRDVMWSSTALHGLGRTVQSCEDGMIVSLNMERQSAVTNTTRHELDMPIAPPAGPCQSLTALCRRGLLQ